MNRAQLRRRCEEFIAWWTSAVRSNRGFQSALDERGLPAGLGEAERVTRLYERTLRPLFARAERCRIFADDHQARFRTGYPRRPASWKSRLTAGADQWLARHARTVRGGALEVDLRAPGVLDDAAFWARLLRSGPPAPTLFTAVTIPLEALDARRFFGRAVDPADLPEGPRAALAFAKRETAGGGRAVLLFDPNGGDVVTFSVVAAPDEAAALFEVASARARLTEQYIASYCTWPTMPLDVGVDLFIEVESSQESDGPAAGRATLLAELRRAAESTAHDDDVLTRGVAAAELVAALGGRPPSRYRTERAYDDETEREIESWVASQRRLALEPEAIALARQVVSQARGSRFADRRWLTRGSRAAWRRALADLAARLRQVGA
ncbi:MAG TPA: hypothetical protein VKA84_03170 [Gemmatimonadaceae bacterium]|nr:hypothetical protein [Gemmatimonadaceae bacterium]